MRDISFTYCTVKNFGRFVHPGNDEIRYSRERGYQATGDFYFRAAKGYRIGMLSLSRSKG